VSNVAPRFVLRLASTSPRRQILLPLLGLPVETESVDVDESPEPGEGPRDLAQRLARTKALATREPRPGECVVAADTVVALGSSLLAKPESSDEARQMLSALRDRPHVVVSGVAIRAQKQLRVSSVTTVVQMRDYTNDEIERSILRGEPFDKAGGYAIQDQQLRPVERIDGCYLNVVGLPLCQVARELTALGWSINTDDLNPPCRFCRIGQSVL
jgi:MAF protein